MSVSSNTRVLYKRYLEIISNWPLDSNKPNRDLGVYIRSRLQELFPKAELTSIESREKEESIRKEIESLECLTQNIRKKQYHFDYQTSTGLTLEQLKHATKSETVSKLNNLYDSGIWNTIKYRFRSMFG